MSIIGSSEMTSPLVCKSHSGLASSFTVNCHMSINLLPGIELRYDLVKILVEWRVPSSIFTKGS